MFIVKRLNKNHHEEESETAMCSANGIIPPRRNGSLTEGYGFWVNDAPFNETDYRDKLWQSIENVW